MPAWTNSSQGTISKIILLEQNGLEVWLKQKSTCLASTESSPEFKLKSHKKKKKKVLKVL
jgi:hypothetical protein